MDLQKAKILLEKINALHKSISSDARNVSVIEKDLMRSYILQLYETTLDLPASSSAPETPAVEIIKSTPRITLNKPEPPAPKTPPEPEKVEEPVIKEPAAPRPEPVIETPPPVAPRPEPEPEPASRPTPPPPAVPKPEPVRATAADEELEELFAFGTAKELSERLSELPIKDIKKSMGLNERIFTVNELFGGDQGAFDNIVDALNQLKSFDEAKNYLLQNVAGKYNWSSKDRKGKAKNFIKLVKRRYN